jgi:ABC-type multidrug transport system permease subunit
MLTLRPVLFFLPFFLMANYLMPEPSQRSVLFGNYGFGWYSLISVLLWTALQNAVIAASLFLYTETVHGTLESLLVSPASSPAIAAANGLFTLGHQLVLVVIGFGALAVLQDPLPGIAAWGLALSVTLLGLATAYGLGLVVGGLTLVTKRLDYSFMAVGLMAFLAGPSYSPSVYPPVLKWLALANPLTYPLDLVRTSLLGAEPLLSPASGFMLLSVWAAASLLVGYRTLNAAIRHLRLTGRAGLF